MSTQFTVSAGSRLRTAHLSLSDERLVWVPEHPGKRLGRGEYNLFLDGVSTRNTHLAYDPPLLTVTLSAAACKEDHDLALGIVRAVASRGEGRIEVDGGGMVLLEQLDASFDDEWQRAQLRSSARSTAALAESRGFIALPGPTRDVWIGPRSRSELGLDDPGIGDRLVTIMRRVLWPDPRYQAASLFSITSRSGESFTASFVYPEIATVLSHTDRVGFHEDDDIVFIPRATLPDLPKVEVTALDDRNHLVEAIAPETWPEVWQAAQSRAIS